VHYQLNLVTPPEVEPLLVGEGVDVALDILSHLNMDPQTGAENARLSNLIKAARRWAENFTNRCFIEQEWDLLLSGGFPCMGQFVLSPFEIRIPRAPVKASGGIVSVKYLDGNGTQQTLTPGADYVVASRGQRTIVLPAYGKSWPPARQAIDASGNFPAEVRFIAGYGADGKTVPENFRQAMLLLIGHWNENREELSETTLSHVAMAAEALLSQDVFVSW
jgi:uncharacterized phiE125 gp8 family phage protein